MNIWVMIVSRNVYIVPDSEKFLKDLEDTATNEDVKRYIRRNIRNYIINEWDAPLLKGVSGYPPKWLKDALDRGDEVYRVRLSDKDKEKIKSWVDFANHVNPSSKLLKISVKELPGHVEKWERTYEDGIEEVYVCKDSKYKWVRVFGEKSLVKESRLMNNCAKTYYSRVSDGYVSLYSLRDNHNNPHITLELNNDNKCIDQVRGNSNKPVKPEYIPYLLEFLKANVIGFKIASRPDLEFNLLLLTEDKKIYYIPDIPEGTYLKGNIILDGEDTIELPNNLHISKNLIIGSRCGITELPSGLTVDGDLDIRHSKIKKYPNDLKVKGRIFLPPIEDEGDNPDKLSNPPDEVIINI